MLDEMNADGGRPAAEALLAAEIGPEAVQVLKPYYSALVGVADLARTTGGQQLRSLLRHLGTLACKVATLEDMVLHWQRVSQEGQTQLAKVSAQLASARQTAAAERSRADVMQAQLLTVMQDREANKVVAHSNAQWLQVEAERAKQNFRRSGEEVIALQEEIRRLRVELEVTSSKQRQQEAKLEAERLRAAGADLTAEQADKAKARLEAALRRADDELRDSVEAITAQMQDEKRKMQKRLEVEHAELLRGRQVVANLEATIAEVRSMLPSLMASIDFAQDPESPALKLARGPVLLALNTSVRVPVLALRWAPKLALNSTPGWKALREGLFALFHQLQTGAMVPEQVELHVCEVAGRWFCYDESEVDRFAALLMYQVLHRDAPILATCRVHGPERVMSTPKDELEKHSGLRVLSTGALWRTPPQDEEDFLRALLLGSSLQEAFQDFLYQRRRGRVEDAFEEELRRDVVKGLNQSKMDRRAAGISGDVPRNTLSRDTQEVPPAPLHPAYPSYRPNSITTAAQAASAAAAAAAQSAAQRERSGLKEGPI